MSAKLISLESAVPRSSNGPVAAPWQENPVTPRMTWMSQYCRAEAPAKLAEVAYGSLPQPPMSTGS